jgi:hypothetical protein
MRIAQHCAAHKHGDPTAVGAPKADFSVDAGAFTTEGVF